MKMNSTELGGGVTGIVGDTGIKLNRALKSIENAYNVFADFNL